MTPSTALTAGLGKISRGIGVLLLAAIVIVGLTAHAGSLLLALPEPADQLPKGGTAEGQYASPGPYPVGLRHLHNSDTPVSFTIWYPAVRQDDVTTPRRMALAYTYGVRMIGADTTVALATYPGAATVGAEPDRQAGPYPLIVMSPGFALTSSSYGWLAEHLASYGFVVASPRHDESLDPQLLWRATVDRPRDVAALIAYLDNHTPVAGDLASLIDHASLAVVGHSYGGYTALAAAGAQLDTAALRAACATAGQGGPLTFQCDALLPHLDDMAFRTGLDATPLGTWPTWASPGVDAVVAVAGDSAMFGPDGLAAIAAPLLAIGGSADADSPYEWGTRAAYAHAASERKVEIKFNGAEHLVFAGDCDTPRTLLRLVSTNFCSDPAWDRKQAQGLVAHFTTAFLLAELTDDAFASAVLSPRTVRYSRVEYRAQGY